MQTAELRPPARAASLAPIGHGLVGVSLLALFALLHHPVGHAREAADILASIRSQTTMDQLVHATLALVFGLLTAAMVLFAARLGVGRVTVVLGQPPLDLRRRGRLVSPGRLTDDPPPWPFF